MSGYAEALAREAELFLRCGLDAYAVDVDPQRIGKPLTHRVNVRGKLRTLSDNGTVGIAESISVFEKLLSDEPQQLYTVGT